MDYETPSPASQQSTSSDSPVRSRGRGRGRTRAGRGRGSRPSTRGRGSRGRGSSGRVSRVRGRHQGQSDRAESAITSLQARREMLKTKIDGMSNEEAKSILHQTAQQFPSLVFDLMKDNGGNGGYHPRPNETSPDWCTCGNCREMPSQPEKLCCRKNPANCVTFLPDFEVLILDEAVLALARLYRQDMFALPDEHDWKKANRHAAYRQFILWQVGRLGAGEGRVIASCAVWKIRDRYPDDFGQYTGFKASRIA